MPELLPWSANATSHRPQPAHNGASIDLEPLIVELAADTLEDRLREIRPAGSPLAPSLPGAGLVARARQADG